jgi:hypothetical protein
MMISQIVAAAQVYNLIIAFRADQGAEYGLTGGSISINLNFTKTCKAGNIGFARWNLVFIVLPVMNVSINGPDSKNISAGERSAN